MRNIFFYLALSPSFLSFAKRPRPPMYSQRDSNVKTSVCSRHDAEAQFETLAGGDGAEAAVRFARDDDRSAVVQVQPMYRSCIEAIPQNNVSEEMDC